MNASSRKQRGAAGVGPLFLAFGLLLASNAVASPAIASGTNDGTVVISGVSPVEVDEPIHVYLEPSAGILAGLPIGAQYLSELVGTFEADADGHFEARIPVVNLSLESDDLATFLVRHGDAFAFSTVGLTPDSTVPMETVVTLEDDSAVSAVPTVNMAAANDSNSTPTPVRQPGSGVAAPDAAYVTNLAKVTSTSSSTCVTSVNATYPNVPHTVMVTGSNTSYAEIRPQYTFGTSSILGYATEVSSGWIKSSNQVTLRNNDDVNADWESQKRVGTYSFRIEAEYQWRTTRCKGAYSNTTYQTDVVIPVRFTGGTYEPAKWASSLKLTHCALMNATTTIAKNRSTTWTNGSKLSWSAAKSTPGISFDVNSSSGYNTGTKITFKPLSANRYLCGAYDVPAGSPGHLMADYTDR